MVVTTYTCIFTTQITIIELYKRHKNVNTSVNTKSFQTEAV